MENWKAILVGSTGKSLLEAPIFASTNPQYDVRFFIELLVQYMKIPNSERWECWEHVVYIKCSECQNKKQFVYTTCSQHVLNMFWALNFHVLNS